MLQIIREQSLVQFLEYTNTGLAFSLGSYYHDLLPKALQIG
jgi:hypothetical protein